MQCTLLFGHVLSCTVHHKIFFAETKKKINKNYKKQKSERYIMHRLTHGRFNHQSTIFIIHILRICFNFFAHHCFCYCYTIRSICCWHMSVARRCPPKAIKHVISKKKCTHNIFVVVLVAVLFVAALQPRFICVLVNNLIAIISP